METFCILLPENLEAIEKGQAGLHYSKKKSPDSTPCTPIRAETAPVKTQLTSDQKPEFSQIRLEKYNSNIPFEKEHRHPIKVEYSLNQRGSSPVIKQELRGNSAAIKQEMRSNSPVIKQELRSNSPVLKQELRSSSPVLKQELRSSSPFIKQELPSPSAKSHISFKIEHSDFSCSDIPVSFSNDALTDIVLQVLLIFLLFVVNFCVVCSFEFSLL